MFSRCRNTKARTQIKSFDGFTEVVSKAAPSNVLNYIKAVNKTQFSFLDEFECCQQ
jgi:hypothetical protein